VSSPRARDWQWQWLVVLLHIDDAAEATALAIERGKAGNVYNIVDDELLPLLPCISD
jgi:nucleoside-diphosphate-sugar epimerase